MVAILSSEYSTTSKLLIHRFYCYLDLNILESNNMVFLVYSIPHLVIATSRKYHAFPVTFSPLPCCECDHGGIYKNSLIRTGMTAGKGAEAVFIFVYFKTIVRKSFEKHLKAL